MGYVRKKVGVLPRDPEMAGHYDRDAAQAPVIFDDEVQRIIIEGVKDICTRRDWMLHAIATEPSHVHLLVSWPPDTHEWKHVHDTLKRLLGMMLSKHLNLKGKAMVRAQGIAQAHQGSSSLRSSDQCVFSQAQGALLVRSRNEVV